VVAVALKLLFRFLFVSTTECSSDNIQIGSNVNFTGYSTPLLILPPFSFYFHIEKYFINTLCH